MTDTGQIPGEGLPENAGMVEQPGVPAPGAYTYLSETTAEDEDLLLLPGAQSAWGNEVAPPAPEPVVETVHQPGPHELSGRDSGSVDLGGVRLPEPSPEPASAPAPPRRPLHLGPPIPDTSASPVRSLADRGPAEAPVRQAGPPTTGPEYLDVPQAAAMPPQGAAPWGTQTAAAPGAGGVHAETVVPAADRTPEPVGAAQALVTRVATEAVAATAGEGGEAAPSAAEGTAPAAAEQAPTEPVAEPAQAVTETPGQPGPDAAPATDAAEAAEAAEAGVPQAVPTAGPTEPAGPVEPAGDPGPEQAAGPVEAPASAQAGDAAQHDAAQPDVAQAVEPPQVPGSAQVVEPAQAAEPVGTVEPAEAPEPVETVEPAAEGLADGSAEAQGPEQAVEPAQVPEAAPVVEPAAAPGAVEAVEPVVAPGPAASAEPVQGTDAPQAAESVQGAASPSEVPGPQEVPAAGAPVTGDAPAVAATATDRTPAEAATEPEGHEPSPETVSATEQPVAAPEAVAEPEVTAQPVQAAAEEDPHPETQSLPQQAAPQADAPQDAAAHRPDDGTVADAQPDDRTAGEGRPLADAQPVPDGQLTQDGPAAQGDQPTPAPDGRPLPDGEPVADGQSGESGPSAQPGPEEEPPVPDAQPTPVAPQPAQGPQSLGGTDVSQQADAPHGAPEPAAADATPTDGAQPAPHPAPDAGHHPDQAVGRFVPVDGGQVPTAPHLAPTPPEALAVPPGAWDAPATQPAPPAADAPAAQATPEAPASGSPVPAPREADTGTGPETDPEVAQNADDLDTRAATDQEDPHDVSTAAEAEARQSTGPAAPAYADAEREAVLKVMRERRDIRNGFRSDPIPHEVLLRVLEAAHTAPSVGHSQPWDFVVIRSADTRRAMHELAMRQRDAYAKSLPKGRAKQFKELKIEAILDTPVNIVVTADPTRGGRHTLGRHTQPQMAPYSSALAVENLWLAARAEGLGVGWVSFFDEREMVRALGLPEHLDVVAYLCVGYVDEFPDEPELMQAGWSKRRPLSWVVHEETYGRRALPGEAPHDLLAETVAQIRPLDAKALGEAWERQKRMTKPAGALGMLEIISAQLSGLSRQCPPPIPEPAAVAVFAGDHGVHAQGVTPWPQEVTAQMVANFLGGGAVCNAFASQVGAEVCVVDVGVATDLPATPGLLPRKIRAGTSDMTAGPAMTREEAKQAIEVGIETARDLVAAGNKALLTGEMGIANTTASAALISVFTGADPAEVTGRGTGINDETLARKTEVVRRAIEVHQPDPADPIGVLAAVGGFEHAAMVGLLLGGASLRTPVILDGVSAGAAALVARAIAPEVLAACIAGHRSAEPGHVAALNKLGLRPLVDLDLRLGEGTGALLALPMVQSTARAMHEVATFDSAGVTEK
ncbi:MULTISPECIES: nicotinate-nucleotide--dimethylbenzimidazole phosphoribosyltransferase [Streptomyces rochei group]|uniref:Nicotinate-nucleotide--dimethylbenzimidazole phosphoribosyltransferase n=1 Tax=Streptomyces plicatus TaxID=1922 RepID=A0ABW1XSS7_STRPL|nr:nicotinate-nucleotide--dimethylbenzimidazole phosphoribosyltransferase [Streptomyces plicatus]